MKNLPEVLTYEEYFEVRKKAKNRKNHKGYIYSEQWELEYKIKNKENCWDDKYETLYTKEKRMDDEVVSRFKEFMKEKGYVENETYEIIKLKYL